MRYVRQFPFIYASIRTLKKVLLYVFRRTQLVLNAKRKKEINVKTKVAQKF